MCQCLLVECVNFLSQIFNFLPEVINNSNSLQSFCKIIYLKDKQFHQLDRQAVVTFMSILQAEFCLFFIPNTSIYFNFFYSRLKLQKCEASKLSTGIKLHRVFWSSILSFLDIIVLDCTCFILLNCFTLLFTFFDFDNPQFLNF